MIKKSVYVILQARTSSNRYKNKVLIKINNIELVILCAKRLSNQGHHLIIATSKSSNDNKIVSLAKHNNIQYFRGSLKNVYSRFINCSKNFDINDIIIRATADNPLPDGNFINFMLNEYFKRNVNYLSSVHEFNNLPYGLSLEIFTVNKLRSYKDRKLSTYQKEHFTSLFKNKFNKNNYLLSQDFLSEDGSLENYSIDTYNDFLQVKQKFKYINNSINENYENIIKKNLKRSLNTNVKMPIIGTAQFTKSYGIVKRINLFKPDYIFNYFQKLSNYSIKYIDTAPSYGSAEKNIGKYFKKIKKEDFKILNKLGSLNISLKNLQRNGLKKIIENKILNSLKKLNIKKIDIYFIHDFKDLKKFNFELINILQDMQKKKLISKIGVSIYDSEELLYSTNFKEIEVIQLPFNILNRNNWDNINFMKLKINNPSLIILVRSILLQGLLINDSKKWPKWNKNSLQYTKEIDYFVKKFNRFDKIDLCIAYVRSFKWIDNFIVGATSISEIKQIAKSFKNKPLSKKQVSYINKTFNIKKDLRILDPRLW